MLPSCVQMFHQNNSPTAKIIVIDLKKKKPNHFSLLLQNDTEVCPCLYIFNVKPFLVNLLRVNKLLHNNWISYLKNVTTAHLCRNPCMSQLFHTIVRPCCELFLPGKLSANSYSVMVILFLDKCAAFRLVLVRSENNTIYQPLKGYRIISVLWIWDRVTEQWKFSHPFSFLGICQYHLRSNLLPNKTKPTWSIQPQRESKSGLVSLIVRSATLSESGPRIPQ